MDLVAFLVRKVTGLLPTMEGNLLDTSSGVRMFKFIFYVSFRTKGNSIALELMEGLNEICLKKKAEERPFELVLRWTAVDKTHWDKEFIRKVLE